jgi:hypothetical protein
MGRTKQMTGASFEDTGHSPQSVKLLRLLRDGADHVHSNKRLHRSGRIVSKDDAPTGRAVEVKRSRRHAVELCTGSAYRFPSAAQGPRPGGAGAHEEILRSRVDHLLREIDQPLHILTDAVRPGRTLRSLGAHWARRSL